MFKIDKNKIVNSSIPLITKGYKVLIEDDEDILFTGNNDFDNRIIGSIIEDNEEEKTLSYINVVVDTNTYIKFIKQKLSYREILDKSENIFIVEKNYQREVTGIYSIKKKDIPTEYLPFEDSYCPEMDEKYSLEYIIRLKGLLSDEHKAVVEDLTHIQLGFRRLLESGIKLLKEFKLEPKIYQEALEPRSIRLGYDIQIGKELFPGEMDLARYLSSYLEYHILHLPNDASAVFTQPSVKSKDFELYTDEIKLVYEKAAIGLPEELDKRIKDELVDGINEIDDITSNIGSSFNEIEILKKFEDAEEPIGYINPEYREIISKAVEYADRFSDKVTIDAEPKYYNIFIYHLNTESRSGNAIIFLDEEKKIMYKPKIKIKGEQSLLKTKYTASLHEQKEIKILGTAKRIKERFIYIEIEFEQKNN